MLKPDKIYKYIAYTFWEHFFFLIAVQNTAQVPQKIHHNPPPPSWTNCLQLSELWEYASGSTALPPKMRKCPLFFSSSFVGLSPWHSSIQCFVQSLFKDSQNWVFLTSLQMKISTASVSRSSRPLKGFNFLGAVLSTGEGGKKGSTLNTLWLKQWKMSSIRFSD